MVTENKEARILWDMQIHTDREIAANKPDIVIKDHKDKTCNRNNTSNFCHGCSRAHQEGTAKTQGKNPWGNKHQ